MPSMRAQPSAPAASARRKAARPEAQPPEREEDELEKIKRAGGFHESSYELRPGMDMFESEWPEGTTIPGLLDDDDGQ